MLQVCGVSVEAILAINPDIADATMVQANDCIALPVPRLLPKIYVLQVRLHGECHACKEVWFLKTNFCFTPILAAAPGVAL
jgi:hypothetical protein